VIWSTFGDELDRVMMGNTILHPCHGGGGGEWDTLRYLLTKRPCVGRKLVGARLLTPYGLTPDVATSNYIAPATGFDDLDTAVSWYVKTCLLFVEDRQKLANFRRHERLAKKHGFHNYFAYRDALSKLCGYSSYHFERKQRWPPRKG
jgi:hypothetical protein